MSFGGVLRCLRVDSGLSLRELAAQVGVSSAYLSRVENGHDPAPTPDRLVAIARALGLPPERLLELADRVEPTVSEYLGEVPAANRLFLEIARRRLSARQLERVLAFVVAEFPLEGRPAELPLRALLDPSRVLLGVRCEALEDAIDLAAARLAPAFATEVGALAAALRAREAQASTVLGAGLQAPHCAVPGGPPRAALLTLAQPLEGPEPVQVLLVIAGLSGQASLTLARVAALARPEVVRALLAAPDAAAAIAAVEAAEWWGP